MRMRKTVMNRLISVLIVDDEAYIREGLRHIVDWEKLGFSICDEAGNGQEALEKIRLYHPGLVLLDIRMPGMSGTDVIRTAREEGYAGEIIVLSGYSDFKYAQVSIHHGVVNYIIKPIDANELTEAVLSVKEKIERIYSREQSLSQYLKKAKSMVLHDILTGSQFDPYINYQELNLDASLYQVVIYENYIPHLQLVNFASLLMIGDQPDQHVEQIRIQDRDVILLKNRLALERFEHWISHYERGYQNGSFMDSVFIVYGEAVADIRKVHRSYKQCMSLIERKFFCDEQQRMLSFRDLPKNESETVIGDEVSRIYSEKLTGYLQTHNRKKIAQTLEELRDFLMQNDFKLLSVRHLLIDIFLEVKNSISHSYGSGPKIPFQKNAAIIELIETRDFLYEILDYFMEQFEMIMSYVGNDSIDNVFDEIVYYVKNNYASQLRLETIGPMFGYSSSYLGKLFLQKCGCSFKTFLDQERIEKSKELLTQTDMKIYEIAARVGYKYVDVFHQKFKKLVQMSPAEYRRLEADREE